MSDDNFYYKEKHDKFYVLNIGDKLDKLFSDIFPNKLKYINRFKLILKEEIIFPNNFNNEYYPEIIDKMVNIDILILTYNNSNKLTFEFLKKFYYLYYNKLEEEDKPKNIIIIEFGNNFNEINKTKDNNNSEEIQKLFKGHFYNYNNNDNYKKLSKILNECVNNLKKIYNFNEDYKFFNEIKLELNKEVNISLLIYGKNQLQKKFIKILLESNIFQYKTLNNNLYEIKYKKIIDNNNINFKINLNLNDRFLCNSISNIILYDINNKESYESIKKTIREYIDENGSEFKQIFYIFAINFNNDFIIYNENELKIQNGLNLSYELGANFFVINIINNMHLKEQMRQNLDNILESIINFISTKKENNKDEGKKFKKSKINNTFNGFELLLDHDSPLIYLKELTNRINNINFENKTNLFINICPYCYHFLNIRINCPSNTIILNCEKCKSIPQGFNYEQYINYKNKNFKSVSCNTCKSILSYNFTTKKLFCNECEFKSKNKNIKNKKNKKNKQNENIFIPCFLKDTYCNNHKKFHKYYLKYNKKGLCSDCKEENNNGYFFNIFDENEIDNLIRRKRDEQNNEFQFICSLKKKFNESINFIINEFLKLIEIKIKIHMIKSELIDNLEVIKNNCQIIDNVESLKFDDGKNFIYNEKDTIENKIKTIFNYLQCDFDINNLNLGKNNNPNIQIYNGPYHNLKSKENDTKVTDIWGINNNKLICVSFNDGQAKIFDLNLYEKNKYPKCIIKAFNPNNGINSIFVSLKDNILKNNCYNKNELIYLNGFEEIKIIQMNNNYDSYNLLCAIKDQNSDIYNSIEIDYNNILMINNFNLLKLICLNKRENNEIISEIKEVTDLLISFDKVPLSLNKITENIISLTLTNSNDYNISISDDQNNITLTEEPKSKKNALKRSKLFIIKNDIDLLNCSKNEIIFDKKESFNIETEKNTKIIYFGDKGKYKDEHIIKEYRNYNSLNIKKEYIFDKNFSLLGSISNDEDLLLLNYSKNNILENILYIFDFKISQLIHSFKFDNYLNTPILLTKINKYYLVDMKRFIICDNKLNLIQYGYNKNYENKIFYINKIKAEKNPDINPFKIVSLDNIIILLCDNNDYYILNE